MCLAIALMVFSIGTAWFLYFYVYLPAGSGLAGPPVSAEPFSKIWSEQKILLLGIGDSITAGMGASAGFSYYDRLVKNPQQDAEDMLGRNLSAVFPDLTTRNIALSGSNSLEHLKLIRKLSKESPEVFGVVVVTTGGNDLIHDYGRSPPRDGAMYGATIEQATPWIENFQMRLDGIIAGVKAVFPGGCHIFLANIYDPSDGTGDTAKWLTGLPPWPDGVKILKAYNEIIAKCADRYEYVHLVNIHDTFLGHGIHCRKFWLRNYCTSDPCYWYYYNIEDPADRGYDAIRRLFLLEMIKVFAKNGLSETYPTIP